MKYYTLQEAEFLMAFYSNIERIECEFELVRKITANNNSRLLPEKVGILCVDKTTTPPLIAELDDVVKGLEFTPTRQVLEEIRHKTSC
jgi:hypothetical protein